MDERVRRVVGLIEHAVIMVLLALLLLVIVVATIDLGIGIVRDIVLPPYTVVLTLDEMLAVLGSFLMVLIALEMMETIRMYVEPNKVHVEVVILVAIIAIARKVIVLDMKHIDPLEIFGIAAIIIALCVGYYFMRRAATLRVPAAPTETDKKSG